MELDTKLGSLARSYPSTKFLRARAATIGFASVESAPRHVQSSIKEEEDEDEYEDEEEVEVDTEMLPTILVYRAGELEFSWVRADWEAGRDGMEELLRKYGKSVRMVIGFSDPLCTSARHRILPTDALALSFASGDDSSDDDYDDD